MYHDGSLTRKGKVIQESDNEEYISNDDLKKYEELLKTHIPDDKARSYALKGGKYS